MYFLNRHRKIVKVVFFFFFNSSQVGWCQGWGAAHTVCAASALAVMGTWTPKLALRNAAGAGRCLKENSKVYQRKQVQELF